MCSCKCFCRCMRSDLSLTHGGTIVLWMMLVHVVNLLPIRLVCARQEQQLLAIHVKITWYVTTEDGYILSLKRIPHGVSNSTQNTTRIPVLLFHGLMVDSVSWVLGTPKQSLGFILADGGFDVWFANTRGTNSSRNHTSLTPDDPVFISSLEYWNWTWDQLAAYDLPAVLQHVYDHTGGQKVHYIGHSLAFHFLGYREFNPVGCLMVEGPDCCLNASTVCNFLQHATQSTSIKNLIHMSQSKDHNQKLKKAFYCSNLRSRTDFLLLVCLQLVIRYEGVRRYDYGNAKENMKHYSQPSPPLYNLSSIPTHVPMFLTHGGQDFLGDVPDTRHLLKTLVRTHDSDNMEVLYVPDYAHADFVIGYNAPQLVYGPMVDFLQRH
ncbi:Triacylglycerol lipase 2 [Triticum urartu]|uniref:Lipase n=1 Tax=Triticum urartu TaxID=4572 RepID=M7ZX64_TRIUA|nr:Triacylglycerol lipase 2 [Triticum urartu]